MSLASRAAGRFCALIRRFAARGSFRFLKRVILSAVLTRIRFRRRSFRIWFCGTGRSKTVCIGKKTAISGKTSMWSKETAGDKLGRSWRILPSRYPDCCTKANERSAKSKKNATQTQNSPQKDSASSHSTEKLGNGLPKEVHRLIHMKSEQIPCFFATTPRHVQSVVLKFKVSVGKTPNGLIITAG